MIGITINNGIEIDEEKSREWLTYRLGEYSTATISYNPNNKQEINLVQKILEEFVPKVKRLNDKLRRQV